MGGMMSLAGKGDGLMTGSSESRAYRAGIAVAVLASFLTVWTTIVRDDGTGVGYFMVILAVAVGWFAAWFRPDGMGRTMVGVAVMQLLLGSLIATAPVTAEPMKTLLFNCVFAALWLLSALFFRAASKGGHQPANA